MCIRDRKQLFAACDAVLLPYLGHQGTSGILSRAAGAGKPAIASDENLIGHVVRHYQMGLLFQSGNVPALQSAMEREMCIRDRTSHSGRFSG